MLQEPIFLGGGHIETLVPYLFRPIIEQSYKRERISTPDDDFLDLDWIQNGNESLIILNHGFESCSRAQYIQGMAQFFKEKSFDLLAWNYRGCSGVMNKQAIFYHSGATYDLELIINHALSKKYKNIILIGFSMGGNLILKYAGMNANNIPKEIKGICAFSTPCCLKSSTEQLSKGLSQIYSYNFLNTLKKKISQKRNVLVDLGIDIKRALTTNNLQDFDDCITAPLHGYTSASDYYIKESCKFFLKDIKVPTLMVSALNDPFLGKDCYPFGIDSINKFIHFETPRSGGHVGFYNGGGLSAPLYTELRCEAFIQKLL